MKYEEFKKELLARLKEQYGEGAEIELHTVKRNNGQSYEGVYIIRKDVDRTVTPIIRIDGLYEKYKNGSMEIQECVEAVCKECKEYEATEDIVELINQFADWNAVKDNVYPVLISTNKNEEMLENLVSTSMLDLSVAYIIRIDMQGKNRGSIRISRPLLHYYNIKESQLHRQAMENLEKDGYSFIDMESLIRGMLQPEESEDSSREGTRTKMYVLTNKTQSYGAAGILDKKLVRNFAKGRNFFILPSSIHETIFVPADDLSDRNIFDNMVKDVNKAQVSEEEQLSDHCYYYDGQTDEVMLCA